MIRDFFFWQLTELRDIILSVGSVGREWERVGIIWGDLLHSNKATTNSPNWSISLYPSQESEPDTSLVTVAGLLRLVQLIMIRLTS